MAKYKNVSVVLEELMSEAADEYNEVLFKSMSKAMRRCKKDIVAAAPGGEKYKRGWSIRTKRLKYGFQGVVFNKDEPGLTHLLERSHLVKNQYGAPKRPDAITRTDPANGVGGKVHIAPAAEDAQEYLIEELAKELGF